MIVVDGLIKYYGPRCALSGVSFTAEKGQVIGLLGPNGAGKTTTMRILASVIQPDGGTVQLGGIDLAADPLTARRKVGYLPEHNPLYPELSANDFLSFVAKAKKAARSELERVVAACGLDEVANRPISKLSKGFRQRVGLAQALVGQPELLILDEPTDGLDPRQIAEIRALIKNQSERSCVIVSSHVLAEVELLCDRVVIMNKGTVVADGSTNDLAAKSGPEVLVKLTGATDEALRRLHALDGVRSVRTLENGGLAISGDNAEALRPAIAETLNGLGLTEMTLRSSSLEDIFLEFVREERGPNA